MRIYSTREAAKKLGISNSALARYIAVKKISPPQMVTTGTTSTHLWTEEQIEEVRKLLPKIANGRKTRHQKKAKTQTTRKTKR